MIRKNMTQESNLLKNVQTLPVYKIHHKVFVALCLFSYYSHWVDGEKKRVNKQTINQTSRMKSKQNKKTAIKREEKLTHAWIHISFSHLQQSCGKWLHKMNFYTNIYRPCIYKELDLLRDSSLRLCTSTKQIRKHALKATSTSKLAVLKPHSKIFLISKSSSSYSWESLSSLLTEGKFGSGLFGYGFFSRKIPLLFVLFNKTGNFGFTTFALSL